eukprot:PITA_34505
MGLNLNGIGKVMTRLRENGIRSEEDYKTHVTKRMQCHTRSSMHLIEDKDFNPRNRTRVMVGSLYNVGHMERIIVGEIVHNIRVAYRKSIVLKRCKQWGMLDRVFLRFMQHWIIGRWITKHLLSRWMGKKKATSVRMVTVMQAKRSRRKGCVLFVVHISSDKGKDVDDVEVFKRYLVSQQFQDVFPVEISELSAHREVEFSIELVLGATPTSKEPYKMSTRELVELKL